MARYRVLQPLPNSYFVPVRYTGILFLIKHGFFIAVAHIVDTKVVMTTVDAMFLYQFDVFTVLASSLSIVFLS